MKNAYFNAMFATDPKEAPPGTCRACGKFIGTNTKDNRGKRRKHVLDHLSFDKIARGAKAP